MSTNVIRLADISSEQLLASFRDPHVPVVITDYVKTWPAATKWTPEFLVETHGDKIVPVVTMTDGDYAHSGRKEMRLADYIEHVQSCEREITDGQKSVRRNGGETWYLAQAPLAKVFPDLLLDIEIPPYISDEKYSSAVMYAGGTLFSQLHYHPRGSAMLCMVYGTKTVRLFPPDQTSLLYPHSLKSGLAHVSQTRHKEPDEQQFPKFSKAKYLEVKLSAGDMLFIPKYWWHSIENEGFSISTVFFWSTSWKSRFLPPPGPRAPYLYEPLSASLSLASRGLNKIRKVIHAG